MAIGYTCLFIKVGIDFGHAGNLWIASAMGFAAFYCAMMGISNLVLSADFIKKIQPEVYKALYPLESKDEVENDDEFERDVDGELIGICECAKCVAYRKEHQDNGDKNSSN